MSWGVIRPRAPCRCSVLYQGKKRRQNASASSYAPNRAGKSGRYLRVLNWASEDQQAPGATGAHRARGGSLMMATHKYPKWTVSFDLTTSAWRGSSSRPVTGRLAGRAPASPYHRSGAGGRQGWRRASSTSSDGRCTRPAPSRRGTRSGRDGGCASTLRRQLNFWPVRKLGSKERHGSKVVKRYDALRTPYQRLITPRSGKDEREVVSLASPPRTTPAAPVWNAGHPAAPSSTDPRACTGAWRPSG